MTPAELAALTVWTLQPYLLAVGCAFVALFIVCWTLGEYLADWSFNRLDCKAEEAGLTFAEYVRARRAGYLP